MIWYVLHIFRYSDVEFRCSDLCFILQSQHQQMVILPRASITERSGIYPAKSDREHAYKFLVFLFISIYNCFSHQTHQNIHHSQHVSPSPWIKAWYLPCVSLIQSMLNLDLKESSKPPRPITSQLAPSPSQTIPTCALQGDTRLRPRC